MNKTEPCKVTSVLCSGGPWKRGCTTSFVTSERNEMAKVHGGIQATQQEEYIQPDAEKEAGGGA